MTKQSQEINIVPVDLQQLTVLVQLYPSAQTAGGPLAVPCEREANCTHMWFWHLEILSVSVPQFPIPFWEVMKNLC